MQQALQILSDEHKNILKVIDALLNECNKLEAGKPINTQFFTKVIEFVRSYADNFHHAKEEDILFKELDTTKMHCNPIPQMLHEHELGRNTIAMLEQGLQNQDKDKIVENAKEYASLLQQHIKKEDNILFPMADDALNEQTNKEILQQYEQAEEKLKDTKNKQLAFLKELENHD